MTGTVTASLLNARARPGIGGRKLAVLPKGAVLEIVGEHAGWYEIRYGKLHAFVCSEYVQIVKQSERHAGIVNAKLLNVRDLPSMQGSVIGSLAAGAVVQVLSRVDGWLEISFNGATAFVSQRYVDVYEQREENRIGTVSASRLNVRSAPALSAPVLGTLPHRSQVLVNGALGDWYEIPFNHRNGFVFSRYVTISHVARHDEPVPVLLNRTDIEDEHAAGEPGAETHADSPQQESSLEPEYKIPVRGNAVERNVASTWNRYGGLLQRLCEEKGMDRACAVAVLCVESAGQGFDPTNENRMIIRFENHLFYKFWGRYEPEIYRQHFRYDPNRRWKGHKWRRTPAYGWKAFHGNQRLEWEVFTFARSLDGEAAMKSISMGAPQIMGFNHETIGYYSVQEMFEAFSSGEEAQIRGLFDFLNPVMLEQLSKRDFVAFAALYNGQGQKEHYGRNIRRHYDAFRLMA